MEEAMQKTRLLIVGGHYGSGKTEFCVNLVHKLRESGLEVAIADLDIVNPYFRSRECGSAFSAMGAKLVSNNFNNDPVLDSPAMSAEIQSFFLNNHRFNICDVGGDAVGARVLARYSEQILKTEYDFYIAINANRYNTQNAEDTIRYIKEIETASGLRANGLINNTHFLRDTTVDDIKRGDALCLEISRMLGVPVKYTCFLKSLEEALTNYKAAGEKFPIDLKMRERWMT